MATTKDQQDKDHAEYADQFGAPDAQKNEISEDEAFGLTDPAPGGADAGNADSGEGTDAPGGTADGAAAATNDGKDPAEDPKEAALREREAQLNAREAELAAREASIQTTNVGEQQSLGGDGDGDGDGQGDGDDDGDGGQGDDDPAKLLADDFGPDFVQLLKRFIEKICADKVGEGVGSISATVDEVIKHLQTERQANHFKAIAAAHSDFMEIVESPEFSAWRESQSPEEKTRLQRVIDSGSAQEIIDMLTAFKASRGAGGGATDSALDDAEGVRGGGMSLPSEPPAADDYAKAWEHA